MFDFVHATRGNTKILARLGDRGDLTAAYVIAVIDLTDYPLRRGLARHEERVGHSNERHVPHLAGARRTVGLDAECHGGRARVQEAAEHAAFDIDHPPSRRTLVVVQVVAVAVESRVRASPQEGRADGPANFVLFERAQEPASPRVRSLHLERAVRFRRMTDDLMRDERIEMRVGHDDDFTLGRLEDGRSGEFLRFFCEVKREGMQVRVGYQFVAPSVCEAFEAALLADRVVGFLVAVSGLRDDIAIALRERESLRDKRAGGVDEKLFAQFAHRGNYVESDIRTQSRKGRRRLAAHSLHLVRVKRTRIALPYCGDLVASGGRRRRCAEHKTPGLRAVLLEYGGLFASVEARTLVSLGESGVQCGDEFRTAEREAPDFNAGLAVPNRTVRTCEIDFQSEGRTFVLGAVARFTVGRMAAAIEHDF